MAKRYIIGGLAAALAIYLLATQVDLKGSLALIKSVRPGVLFVCAGIYLIAHVFRALRFSLVLGGGGPGFMEMLAIVSIHNLMNQLMPVRTGEGVYPVLLKKVSGVGYGRGVSSLLIVRVYDLATFSLMFIVFLAYKAMVSGGVTMYGAAGMAVLLVMSLAALRHMDAVIEFILAVSADVMGRFGSGKVADIDAAGRMAALAADLKALETGRNFVMLTAQSVVIWLLTYAMFHEFLESMGGGAGFVDTVLGSSGAVLTTLLPVNTFGSIGTLEGGWTLGLAAVGVDRETALASGLLMHVFVIAFGLLLAVAGAVTLRLAGSAGKAG